MPLIKNLIFIPIAVAIASISVLWVKYDEWISVPRAREPVRAMMKDPASAQFQADYLESNGWLCGELNSKNEYGAYVGFKRFMSNKKSGRIYFDDTEGMSGGIEESTIDFITRLDKEIALRKRQNELRAAGKPAVRYSQYEINTMVAHSLFDDKWAENCPSSTQSRRS